MRSVRIVLLTTMLLSFCGCSVLRYAPPEIGDPMLKGYFSLLGTMCGGLRQGAEAGALLCPPALAIGVMDGMLVATELVVEQIIDPAPLRVPELKFGLSLWNPSTFKVWQIAN